ncbi:sugar phosphate isomerase/epimerase [Rhodoplanes sp. TEM]|uniref:Sugar phosphate isomerase/epimerase n=1 Tax=Rhodoplanes tepidamans TaxID=200616 RepID=A0ABT5JFC8_RHOTP|nr:MULTISPECIES: sugar phosphate isomerase/epimerase family protein [Rhodoplanes]MDC7788371.1 sugar phosphate isomerase/epimerase [Rhodoplanes tepidamans]MDC7985348.1 sugar phosphate isomerase/epimerase [Rhodoplanes sp. TEM]MDQ0357130.1 sugar phosphate isomerase/epimerase [Rhodoplanes tepidamans]
MRIALCNEVIAALPFDRQCGFAAAVGYDGLEVAPFTLSETPHLMPAAERAALRRAAAEAGIAITGLHYLMRAPAGLSITTTDAAARETSIDVMRRLCGLAHDLGAGVLVHGSPDQRRLDPGSEADGRKRAADAFAAVAAAAAEAGVVYCIEPLSKRQTDCINTVAEAAAIVQAVDSPALRTMIDCSSSAVTEAEPVPELIRRWIPTGLIGHVHFNDPNRRGPGEGELEFAPIVTALREVGWRDVVGVEPFVYEPDGPACAARAIGYVRALLEAIP